MVQEGGDGEVGLVGVEADESPANRARIAEADGVVDLAFHVYGLPRRTLPTPDFSGYEHLIVSPFLMNGTITEINVKHGVLSFVLTMKFSALEKSIQVVVKCQTFVWQ